MTAIYLVTRIVMQSPCAHRVGNAVAEVGQGIFQVSLEHLCDLDDWFQPTPRRPAIPALEELTRIARVAVFPEPAELFLDRPSP